MKTLTGILLVLGLTTTALFAQAQPAAPGKNLELSSPTPPPDGPLTSKLSLDDVPATPATQPPEDNRPVVVDPAIKAALADKTDEEQQQFVRLLMRASTLIQQNEVQSALELILDAEAIESDFFGLHNLKGASFSKIRAFDKAIASFNRCLELNPDSMEAKFNLAEMDFVQQDYAVAFDKFTKLLVENPKMPGNTRSLLQYKNYLCLLKLDRTEEADAVLETFRFDSDTPEFYLGNAAKSFNADDKADAGDWIGSAGRIYNRGLVNLYLDSLIEIGWIESL